VVKLNNTLSLKHSLKSFTVTTVAGFLVIFWTTTIPSTTASFLIGCTCVLPSFAGSIVATDVTDLELSSSSGKDSVSFANLSSALISADLSVQDSRLPSGAKSALVSL